MKVCELIGDFVGKHCSPYVFGVPGSYIMPIWQNLKKNNIILCTNEADAGYIATGYCRGMRKPTLMLTTASPGITNAISGIASAYKDQLPLIIISGAISETAKGTGAFQEDSIYNGCFDSFEIVKNVTKKSYYLNDPTQTISLLIDAFRTAMSIPRGCVHITIPVDVQNMEVNQSVPKSIDILPNRLIQRIPPQLKDAVFNGQNILFICGWEVYLSGQEKEFKNLCETGMVPFITTMKGVYCADMSSPCFLGKTGMALTDDLLRLIKQINPSHIIGFGTCFEAYNFPSDFFDMFSQAEFWSFGTKPQHPEFFSKKIRYIDTDNLPGLIQEFTELIAACSYSGASGVSAGDSNITRELACRRGLMAESIWLVNQLTTSDMLVTADAGNHYLDALFLIKSKSVNGFWIDAGLSAMGNGICGTIGMAFAKTHSAYICLTGDGCALMNGNSISVAADNQLPILFIIFNNQSLGRVRVGQMNTKSFISSSINNVNFAKWGEAFSIDSVRVYNAEEVEKEITSFLSTKKTKVLEIITDKNEIPFGVKI